ncbi:hypothetical protein ROS1_30940 [Roseibium sp. ROS1]
MCGDDQRIIRGRLVAELAVNGAPVSLHLPVPEKNVKPFASAAPQGQDIPWNDIATPEHALGTYPLPLGTDSNRKTVGGPEFIEVTRGTSGILAQRKESALEELLADFDERFRRRDMRFRRRNKSVFDRGLSEDTAS